jgi:hypothetical protein
MRPLERRIAMLLVAASAVACGAAELEQSGRTHRANQAIWTAEEAGARQDPRGEQLLEMARREMMSAQAKADDGDERNAALLFERAEADSKLALQIARTNSEREKANRAWQELAAARSEFWGGGP